MALNVSGYTDPGVLIGEVIVPAGITVATTPDLLCIVATGDRQKRAINEAVQRGQVLEESLTVDDPAPHTSTLTNRGDRRISNTTIRRTLGSDTIELPATAFSYLAAELDGGAETYDLSTNNAIGLKIDNGQEVTMTFADGASAVNVTGSLIEVTTALASGATAATAAEVAAGINAGLVAATSLGYGPNYGSVASDNSGSLKLTSPTSGSTSDVQVLEPFANDATATLGFVTPARADTVLEIDSAYFDSSATWEIDYVSVETDLDTLENSADSIVRIGSFAGVRSFTEVTDYDLTSGDIDWSPDTAATFTGSVSETYDVSTNDQLLLALDGNAAVAIDLNGLASPPPGYADPASPAAATAAEIANNINAILSVASGYGPRYRSVASDSGGFVRLTSPNEGASTSVELSEPSSNDATTSIFGLSSSQLTHMVMGTGNSPSVGTIYFTTYEYTRPSDEYEEPKRFFSEDAMVQDLGPVASDNRLSLLGQIAFDNEAPSIITIQVDDADTPGFPTTNEVKSAIDSAEKSSLITDLVVDDTRLGVHTHLLSHIENQSSVTEKNYRSGWFGMPDGTEVGDKDTPDSYAYRAGVTLQVSPDSPARGRLFLVAPAGARRTITNEDGVNVTLTLSSNAVAVAAAAKHTSFTSPAVSLAGKTLVGFTPSTFPTFLKAERAQLVTSGVFVVTNIGGRLEMLDPVSTERGGGNLSTFLYRSLSSQKDNVTKAVDRAIDRNLRGIVPEDLADFIFDIKTVVGSVLTSLIESGAIGPFRDSNGVARDIDLSRDVQAEQSRNEPTKFFFRYFFYLRYPALRFFGQFSVDNPFFEA